MKVILKQDIKGIGKKDDRSKICYNPFFILIVINK